MTPPPLQQTRYAALERRLGLSLLGQWRRSWRNASLAMLALLLGIFLSQNLITLAVYRIPGGRPTAVFALVLAMEVVVRIRSRIVRGEEVPLAWVMADNLRLGITYAVVLEAFKLGT
jgi:hypothetical protein